MEDQEEKVLFLQKKDFFALYFEKKIWKTLDKFIKNDDRKIFPFPN
jgi:hypothetical protein